MENEQTPKPVEEVHHETHEHESKSWMSKWPFIVIAILLILIVLLAGLYFINSNKTTETTPTPTPTETQATPEPSSTTSTPSGKFELNKTYSSPDKWQIDYPGAFKLEPHESQQMGPNGIGTPVVISYLGPTQGSGTEFHDGVSFSIGVQKKSANQSVKDALDEYSKPNPEVGSTRTELKPITVNSLSGYETTLSSFGTGRIIFLNYPGANDKVYIMSIFADGPAPSDADYQAAAEKMIKSFRNI